MMRGMGAFAAVLVVMLGVGTFADYQIAQAIYTPDNPFVIYSDKHYVRLEFAIMNLLQKWYPARKEYITLLDQAIIYKNGRTYDLLRYIVTSGNDTHYEDYYFDITNHLSDED